ncbi:MAG: 30S ribosomal protein S3 [Mycoplasma sp.]
MGQKVNSNGLRYGIYKEWESRWISNSNKQTAEWLVQDDKIRTYFERKWKLASVSRVQIERKNEEVNLFINTAQPGLFGDQETVKKITLDLNKMCGRNYKFNLNFIPIVNTYVNARLAAREVADSIEKRVSFRTAQKQIIKKVMRSGALGIKTRVSGRLGGVEMAREEGYSEGVIPLSTLRADIDYALEEAHTTYGIIGVKVWINRGTIFKKGEISKVCNQAPSSQSALRYSNNKPKNNYKKPATASESKVAPKE